MEDLISKRELLERYGVSYGALYRWKRMGLIPEDWFLRRATPTGQETFFHSRRFRLEELKSITLIVDGQAQELLPKQKGVHQK